MSHNAVGGRCSPSVLFPRFILQTQQATLKSTPIQLSVGNFEDELCHGSQQKTAGAYLSMSSIEICETLGLHPRRLRLPGFCFHGESGVLGIVGTLIDDVRAWRSVEEEER